MPELPEVEIAARQLRAWLSGRRIAEARFRPTRILRGAAPEALRKLVRGRRVREVVRRGKWLRLELDGGAALYAHLGMTGKWVRRPLAAPAARHERARLDTRDTSVRYLDQRMFGRLVAAPSGEPIPEWRALGPDPLVDGVDVELLAASATRTTRTIKALLMDQGVLAGVGNIQATEALWRARVHPERRADSLERKELRAIARGIRDSISFTLEGETDEEIAYVEEPGAPNPFRVYAKAGAPCPRCKTQLERMVLGGRATVFCPRCQPRPFSP